MPFIDINPMRLSKSELQTIRDILYSADPQGKIYLFGSRSNDKRRGGDIDLYFEASKALDLRAILTLEYRLTSQCGTHVDLLVKNPNESEQPIFFIARQGVLI
jgi:predicted nucleotidyltransferase